MDLPTDVLIGLDAGTSTVTAVAFAPDGREIALSTGAKAVHQVADGGVEQDPGEAWQAAAAALRDLAGKVPHLAARTAVVAITGPDGGTWLVDEDGDPVAPAWLAADRRATGLVARWRRESIGRELRAITGRAIEPALASAQIACLAERQPTLLDRAATAFQSKDWLYFCCTHERATDSASAAGAFGSFRTGDYDARVLDLLHLQEIARLLPEIVDGRQTYGELTEAAAAATGLVAGTPVVLGPIDLIATALAAGLAADAGLGCSILNGGGVHVRADHAPLDLGPECPATGAMMPYAATWFKATGGPAAVTACWLLELATQLLADAGLIGIRRDELVATLEQKAGAASPGALICHPGAWQVDRRAAAAFLGISGATTFYDLLRSIREADGRAARTCYDALGGVPEELRVTGEGAANPLARRLLAACVGAPLRVIRRATPAAAGAAMIATIALGHNRTIEAASRDWVGPHLGDLEPVDDRLREVYARTMAGPLATPGVLAAACAGA